MCRADEQRFETTRGRTRVELIMMRLAPYGILVVDNHWHMVGRIMTRLQLEMQKVHREPEYRITPLHEFPSDAQQRTHAMYAWGGAISCVLVVNWTGIKGVLDGLLPLTSATADYWSVHGRYSMNEKSAVDKLVPLLQNKLNTSPLKPYMGRFDVTFGSKDVKALATACVYARWQADYDELLERRAVGLPVSSERHDWDWGNGDDRSPLLERLDNVPVLSEAERNRFTRALAELMCIVAASDGSADVAEGTTAGEDDEENEDTAAAHCTKSGASLFMAIVDTTDATWQSTTLDNLLALMERGMKCPTKWGNTNVSSYEVELVGVLNFLRVMCDLVRSRGDLGAEESKEVLRRCHLIVDNKSALTILQKLISPETDNVIGLTSREIRRSRASHLLSRIAHRLEWLNSFKHVGKGTVTDNPLSEQLHGWKENREDGVKVHEMMPTSIGGASQSWLRSHQSQDKAGPCSIAWACNKRADDLAAEAANQASANISYLDARDADKVRFAAGGARVEVAYLGDALYGSIGTNFRGLNGRAMYNDLVSEKTSTRARIMQRVHDKLASPCAYKGVEVDGQKVDLEESMYATRQGSYGRLDIGESYQGSQQGASQGSQGSSQRSQQAWIDHCPLCNERYNGYSTRHASTRCTNERMMSLRRRMLTRANNILRNSSIKMQQAFHPIGAVKEDTKAVVGQYDEGTFCELERAGNFMLDGDDDTMRGVPLHRMAVWISEVGMVKGKRATKSEATELLRTLTATVTVDNQDMLDEYKELVAMTQPDDGEW